MTDVLKLVLRGAHKMTKSQNIKNEQLTEQWKKGKLPSGEYYIIDDLGLHTTDKYYPSHGFGTELPQSVLGRVPSYDEWEQLQNWADFTNDYHELREKLEIAEYKNAKLKELLKECFEYIDWTDGTGSPISQQKLLDEIKEALK